MNILIVEDDIVLASHIVHSFTSCVITNRITVISSPLDFLGHLHMVWAYDIILTDLALFPYDHGLWGYTVIESVRKNGINIPIIVISGKWDIDILRHAFDIGATDYIIKPFRLKELEVRVHHWFKNYCFPEIKSIENQYLIDGLTYDIKKNEFYRGDTIIRLTRSYKYLFFLFFSNQWRLLSQEFLKEKIWWDYDYMQERNLRVTILRLRKLLKPYDLHHTIRTVRGEWYIFEWGYSSIYPSL